MPNIASPGSPARPFVKVPAVFFAVFTLSGFSGLIYESIWSHYLKLFLGHAAYAQSLVLVIFMGGLAGGSWLAARLAPRFTAPVLAYAAVEAAIGAFALVFHETFVAMLEVFFDVVLTASGPGLGTALKWLAAALLIAPQSVLLGMTFPLLAGGLLRRYPDGSGATIATLYFTNSIGGGIGVLASGFWLIEAVGLPGTIRFAGALNLLLAALVWALARRATPQRAAPAKSSGPMTLRGLFLLGAAVTGAASFLYEIAWIRMLSLVLGASTRSFELMLSAFIMGLAFGSLWIRRRIDRIADPLAFAGWVQVIMGFLAIVSLAIYMASFDWMAAAVMRLPLTDAGFRDFTLVSHAIAVAVMFPATFMAGMTLPLFTHVLVRDGFGESAIGHVYASNTVGSILGVLAGVHLALPVLGLKGTVASGAALDVALGLLLLGWRYRQRGHGAPALLGQGVAIAVVAAGAIALVRLEPAVLVSGVFRHGRAALESGASVRYYQDGKTSTISVVETGGGRLSIATNGKPDASLQPDTKLKPSFDEMTMTLLGSLPIAYHPSPRRIANIGFGSGMTAHILLGDSRVERVDTVEIEPFMVRGAHLFEQRLPRAFGDPRSRIHIEDAKSFFTQQRQRYDVIVAEPSNPWVSGVANLFSTEFYRLVSRYLEDDGLLVQWVQFYEFDDRLAMSVVKALLPHFDDCVLYSSQSLDGIIVARKRGRLGEPDFPRVLSGDIGWELRRVGLRTAADIRSRQSADREALARFAEQFRSVPANSDYYPYVDLHAPAARFKNSSVKLLRPRALPPATGQRTNGSH